MLNTRSTRTPRRPDVLPHPRDNTGRWQGPGLMPDGDRGCLAYEGCPHAVGCGRRRGRLPGCRPCSDSCWHLLLPTGVPLLPGSGSTESMSMADGRGCQGGDVGPRHGFTRNCRLRLSSGVRTLDPLIFYNSIFSIFSGSLVTNCV